jgi:hypothetical protein
LRSKIMYHYTIIGLSVAWLVGLSVVACSSQTGIVTSRTDITPDAGSIVNPPGGAQFLQRYDDFPMYFEENQGQTNKQVKFLARGQGYNLFLTANDATLVLHQQTETKRGENKKSQTNREAILNMQFIGSKPTPHLMGLEKLRGKSSYFLGNDPAKWQNDVSHFAKVKYKAIYDGIDLVYYGNPHQFEYDLVVSPGADPKAIAIKFEGAEKIEVDRHGSLMLHTTGGQLYLTKPLIYQEVDGVRKSIDGGYIIEDSNRIRFQIAAYDATKALVIDPVLNYATYLGGSGNDQSDGIAVDRTGSVYVVGLTNSLNFPTKNAVQPRISDIYDVFVAKLTPDGTALDYATYLGGGSMDSGLSIAVDPLNNVYVTGFTYSTNFPRANPIQSVSQGGREAFIAKLDSTGTALVYSTFLGGSGDDQGRGIAADSGGNAYVVGETHSGNFPTANALQPSTRDNNDAFVTKLDSAGSLVFSTYLGGSGSDEAKGVVVDSLSSIYITGETGSTDFPTVNAFQPSQGGNDDAFVVKLDPAGTTLVYATYLGGSGGDWGYSIAVDGTGSAYVTGPTASWNFPTVNALQPSPADINPSDAFISKLNPAGNALLYSTYLGSGGVDIGRGIAVDADGSAYIVGQTDAQNFPVVDPVQASMAGGTSDAFVAKLNPAGSALLFSTYFGGSALDEGWGIATDDIGGAYVVGRTYSQNFPTTALPFQSSYNGGAYDAFVAKISFQNADAPVVDAGDNIAITSQHQCTTVVNGSATDTDSDLLQYRWKEGTTVLQDWEAVAANNAAILQLCQFPLAPLPIGEHTLTLEVTDGQSTSSDEVILTIGNSAPHAAPLGAGTYQVNDQITIGGQVSDYDNDPLSFGWYEGVSPLNCSGVVQASAQSLPGTPVTLPDCTLLPQSLGSHAFTLSVSDGVNQPPSNGSITVEVVDNSAPTLTLDANKTILWPPNHKMVDIAINAYASDNSGLPVTLKAIVVSNELQNGTGEGDIGPDWTEPVINQVTGLITLQIRAERSGSGHGRVYTITVAATDSVGNTSTTSIDIIVPHDQSKK